MVHVTMNTCVNFSMLVLFNTFYKTFLTLCETWLFTFQYMWNVYNLKIHFPHQSEWTLLFLWLNESLVSSLTSSLKGEFDHLDIELIMIWPNPAQCFILTSWHAEVTLQWTLLVESSKKPVFVYVQMTVICGISSL